MSKKRLTERTKLGSAIQKSDVSAREMIDKLAEYEELEEQGLFLRLPCKVGDTVYYPEKDFDYVYPVKISQIIISDLGDEKQCRQYNGCFFDCNGDVELEFEFEDDDFGKTVFLTQAEAEEKLRELEGVKRRKKYQKNGIFASIATTVVAMKMILEERIAKQIFTI